jgi:subtilisin family serine protease
MRVPAVLARSAFAAGFLAVAATAALAQWPTHSAPGRGGGGGGFGDYEMYDPCAYGDCYRRPRRPPTVIIVPDDGPYIYEEDLGPAPEPRKKRPKVKKPQKAKPKVEQAKPKPKNTNKDASGQLAAGTFRPDEVLVETSLSVAVTEIDALAQEQRIEKLGSQEIGLLNTRLHRWRITDGRSPESVAAALRTDGRVSDANVNSIFSLQQNATPAGPPQYAADKLKLAEAHALTRGEATIIAVIDSGADGTHPELAGVISNSFDAIGGEFKPHAHGTGMAGAIAGQALLKGVAPKARILDVRAFAPTGKTQDGTTFDVVRGMDWAAQNGARIFNLSFAGPRDPLMSRVVKAAIEKGIVVIAAAGNAGPNSPPLYPAAETGVIAVTATDSEDRVMKVANRGGYVTIAAPGVDILLPAPQKAYAVSSGTSIATAYVSGIAALMIAKNPEADGKEVYEVLTGTARDLGSKGRDKDFGAGLADPLAALEAMEPIPQTVAAPAIADEPVR